MLNALFAITDKIFRKTDKTHIKRTRNIRLIPDFQHRRGGKLSYAEWADVIGIFQTIIYQTLTKKSGNKILDVGCGTGLLGISAEPFTSDGGSYTGIDITKNFINYCQSHYTASNYKFIHFDVANALYASDQSKILKPWPIEDNSQDLVTALSVWTHLNEEDSLFYFKEINRVLKKGGRAMVTFFYLNDEYEQSLTKRSDTEGRFHGTNQNTWLFNQKAYDSENWLTIPSAKYPEDAIGITEKAFQQLLDISGLKLVQYYPGNWKEIPGVFFQDILIFEK